MTFSLLGRCARTGRLGMVVSSSSPAVAARCAWGRPGVGMAGTQNITDPRLGPAMLDALERTGDPRVAVDEVVAAADGVAHRQLLLLDAGGMGAVYSGARSLRTHGDRTGDGCVAAGNLLSSEGVLDAMIDAFRRGAELDLGDRLVAVLRAAVDAGGESGPVHSAGLLLIGEVAWPVADLRVDWHDEPVAELERVWQVYKPQLEDYIARALDPDAAPGHDVPGE